MRDEIEIEAALIAKGLTAARLTPALIDSVIVDEAYHVFAGTTTTVCCLMLRNGYTIIGESACASVTNFDEKIGRELARVKARDRIWELEGYLLRERLYAEGV